jgi:hypothetical protein
MKARPADAGTDGGSARRERLRRAKRAQRERDRQAGLVACQVKLPAAAARRLREVLSVPGFETALAEILEEAVVDTEAYPMLRDLCWSRTGRYLVARDALALYERNWRFVDQSKLTDRERELIHRLAERFGGGLLNV